MTRHANSWTDRGTPLWGGNRILESEAATAMLANPNSIGTRLAIRRTIVERVPALDAGHDDSR